MQAVQFLGNCNGSYTHDVHDFDIHIFADEVDQVDHSMIKKLYLPFQNESLYFEHNNLR